MIGRSLSEDYLRWLGLQIRDEGFAETHFGLLQAMREKEFVWSIPWDDNRLGDGLDLRAEFCFAHHIRADALKNEGPCSFLEVLIGLSRRLSFAAGSDARYWAWHLLDNLKLVRMQDPLTRGKLRRLDDILDTVIWRTYRPDGLGGFFPLSWPEEGVDMTQIELWYQMAAYINELHPEH